MILKNAFCPWSLIDWWNSCRADKNQVEKQFPLWGGLLANMIASAYQLKKHSLTFSQRLAAKVLHCLRNNVTLSNHLTKGELTLANCIKNMKLSPIYSSLEVKSVKFNNQINNSSDTDEKNYFCCSLEIEWTKSMFLL